APPSITFVMGTRALPGFNLSRLRVSGSLLEIGSEDLRFRSWEVEHLFRDFYREPLPPEELAELARRTEGWAAGLQLFHLATRSRSSWTSSVRFRPGRLTAKRRACWNEAAPSRTRSRPTRGARTGRQSTDCCITRAASCWKGRIPGSMPCRRRCCARTPG